MKTMRWFISLNHALVNLVQFVWSSVMQRSLNPLTAQLLGLTWTINEEGAREKSNQTRIVSTAAYELM